MPQILAPMRLGVNVDHIATLRQQRQTPYPDLIALTRIALDAGADQITLHLREDRRHIQPDDVLALRSFVPEMNLEMAMTPSMVDFALQVRPDWVCIVPERRQELTTEGGLDVIAHQSTLQPLVRTFTDSGIRVSMFINAQDDQIAASAQVGAQAVELHTGGYADWYLEHYARFAQPPSLEALSRKADSFRSSAQMALSLGLLAHAGHGLTRANLPPIAMIAEIRELNIGHALISDALEMGLARAVRAFKTAIHEVRGKP